VVVVVVATSTKSPKLLYDWVKSRVDTVISGDTIQYEQLKVQENSIGIYIDNWSKPLIGLNNKISLRDRINIKHITSGKITGLETLTKIVEEMEASNELYEDFGIISVVNLIPPKIVGDVTVNLSLLETDFIVEWYYTN
jgi:hypothetical protein